MTESIVVSRRSHQVKAVLVVGLVESWLLLALYSRVMVVIMKEREQHNSNSPFTVT